ncbi:hypothetical protein MWU65_10245 [Cellulophaga sp. F20128]|uniref:hypothetical protein n=1 Tax=Cellulophaga sp. F20128 TaxID=2926413 RepID=UPI001FF1905B|nr:hypothetical protein [Cellulophaga sp. F20128]MCK0157560.1 hypothetical protein [Cellulophaga sp. F20128]
MNYLKHLFILFSIITSISCSSDNNDSDNTSRAKGTITLSGEETSAVGTSLKVENIVVGSAQTGTAKSVTLLHKNIKVENGELNFTDPDNTFIIVTAQFENTDNSDAARTISMAINVNGEEYKFACSTPEVGTFVNCGDNFNVNQSGKIITFNNTTVINTKSGKILTMNGSISW